jgi:hypothetical protein
MRRQCAQREIEQPFLLPEHRTAAQTNQYIGLIGLEMEIVAEPQFHGEKRDIRRKY